MLPEQDVINYIVLQQVGLKHGGDDLMVGLDDVVFSNLNDYMNMLRLLQPL